MPWDMGKHNVTQQQESPSNRAFSKSVQFARTVSSQDPKILRMPINWGVRDSNEGTNNSSDCFQASRNSPTAYRKWRQCGKLMCVVLAILLVTVEPVPFPFGCPAL